MSAEPISLTASGVPAGAPAPPRQEAATHGNASRSPTGSNSQGAPRGGVYLLHFDQRYEHAGHYTGMGHGWARAGRVEASAYGWL